MFDQNPPKAFKGFDLAETWSIADVDAEGWPHPDGFTVCQLLKGGVAGDAAHCHSPVGGRGMNLGIADAADLASRLTGGDLSRYSSDRHAEGARVIAGSERMRKVLTSPSSVVRALVFTVLKTASVLSPLRRRIASNLLYG